jgi:hypothetical protein
MSRGNVVQSSEVVEQSPWLLSRKEQLTIPRHVVIRFSYAKVSPKIAIDLHQKVVSEFGSVWVAKLGRPMGAENIAALNAQCSNGKQTFLFLAAKQSNGYLLFRGDIMAVSTAVPENEKHLVPDYYTDDIWKNATFWAKVSHFELRDTIELAQMHVAGSGQTVSEMFSRTRTAMILVRMGKGIAW